MDNIKNSFINYIPYINGSENYKRASVTVPLVTINGEINILFQLRSNNLSTNPNEICFPGGSIEKDEAPLAAAIRETSEELGMDKSNFSIISPLNLFISPFNIIIHPYLIEIKNLDQININKAEVEEILYIPLDYLKNHKPNAFMNKLKMETSEDFPYAQIPNGKNYNFKVGKYETLFYTYKDYTIWGLTARILYDFIEQIK